MISDLPANSAGKNCMSGVVAWLVMLRTLHPKTQSKNTLFLVTTIIFNSSTLVFLEGTDQRHRNLCQRQKKLGLPFDAEAYSESEIIPVLTLSAIIIISYDL